MEFGKSSSQLLVPLKGVVLSFLKAKWTNCWNHLVSPQKKSGKNNKHLPTKGGQRPPNLNDIIARSCQSFGPADPWDSESLVKKTDSESLLPCIGLSWSLPKPCFGGCPIYFHYGVIVMISLSTAAGFLPSLVGGWTAHLKNICDRQIGSFPQGLGWK